MYPNCIFVEDYNGLDIYCDELKLGLNYHGTHHAKTTFLHPSRKNS